MITPRLFFALAEVVLVCLCVAGSVSEPVSEVSRSDTTFRLYNKDSDVFTPIYYGQLDLIRDVVPANSSVKIIIHGWVDNADSDWYKYIKEEYMKKGDYVIIGVDWSKPAKELYPSSAAGTRDVGQYVGELVLDFFFTLNVPLGNVHLIGHSLGAQIAGFAGQYVNANWLISVGRISGLDPAGPLFEREGPDGRLSHDDAMFVDVIHTDAGKFGYVERMGHVDFYPNGGHAPQVGCAMLFDIVDVASCSHKRVYWLFGESINSVGFQSRECNSMDEYKNGQCDQNKCAIMGENVDLQSRGTFYLTTNGASPFATSGKK